MEKIILKKDTLINKDILLKEGESIQVLKEASEVYKMMSDYPKARPLVGKAGEAVRWEMEGGMTFCIHLLEDINYPNRLLNEVEALFQKHLDSF